MSDINPEDLVCSSPHLLIAYVQCQHGNALPGLFLLYRPAIEAKSVWGELFPDVERNFTLAMVDRFGYLNVIPDGVNPWPEFYRGGNPHGVKVVKDHPYEMYLVRHPDVDLARTARDELNRLKARNVSAGWKFVTKEFTHHARHLTGGESVEELVLTLDDTAGSYNPAGSGRYQNWVLYRDMPHAACSQVQDAVKTLQIDLGKLRFVVGTEPPYLPEPASRTAKGVLKNPDTANEGIFDARTLNSVYAFQKDCVSGETFMLDDPNNLRPNSSPVEDVESSWKYLNGSGFTGSAISLRADGVVAKATGDAIAQWFSEGRRNSQAILVAVPAREGGKSWIVWMRPEAAEMLYAWRELTKALGFPRGIAANHTYRGVLVDVGHAAYGRSAVSIHKTGLAIDTGVATGFREPVSDWPILFTQDVRRPQKNKAGQEGFRMYWRLFAVSDYSFTGGDDGTDRLEPVRKKLRAATKDSHRLGGLLRTKAAQMLAQTDASGFYETYFCDEIQPWTYDPWDPDGGKPLEPITGRKRNDEMIKKLSDDIAGIDENRQLLLDRLSEMDDVPKAQRDKVWHSEHKEKTIELGKLNRERNPKQEELDARKKVTPVSFINLTAVAEFLGLERIGSFTNMDIPVGTDWGLAARTVKVSNFQALTGAISESQAARSKLDLRIGSRTANIGGVDVAFMSAWAQAQPALRLCAYKTPQARCVVSRHKDGDKRVDQICGALDKFPDKAFRRVETDETKTGADFAAEIRAKHDELKANAPTDKTDGSKSSKQKSKEEWTWTLEPIFGTARFSPGEVVYLPAEGAPIGMEWWHFQVKHLVEGRTFGELMNSLGWDDDILKGEPVPHLHYRSGAGYPATELTKRVG